MNVRLVPILFVLFGCLGCSPEKLTPLEFFEVRTGEPDYVDLGVIRLNGDINGLETSSVEACGFVWSLQADFVPSAVPGSQTLATTPPAGEGDFSATLSLQAGQTIYYQAFAVLGERRMYGAVKTFTLGEIVRLTGRPAVIFNNTAVLEGRLLGLTVLGATVQAHGFVVSATNPLPVLDEAAPLQTNLLASNDDIVFTDTLRNLEFNTRYFVRAYAKTPGRTYYSAQVDSFTVLDGWVQIGDFPYFFQEGTAVSLNGFGYAGLGCNREGACLAGELPTEWWRFDPAGDGSWQSRAPFPAIDGFIRTNALSFALGDTVYVMFGEFIEVFGGPYDVMDFWRYIPQTNVWEKLPKPAASLNRSGAVAFVLNGKVYVGSGRTYPNNVEAFLDDFWEYDPGTETWKPMASLPVRRNEQDPVVYWAGRREAAAFSDGQYGYVGGGASGGFMLRDFWRFHPPTPAQDTGHWELVGFFPGEGRVEAVSFVIDNIFYYGMGYSFSKGYLADFWAYDIEKKQWDARTPFIGGRRGNAIGFAIGNRGYAGTGQNRVAFDNVLDELIYQDFWRYIPRE